jgi:hypothetical protein
VKRNIIDVEDQTIQSVLITLRLHAHAVALLPDGLRMTWDAEGDNATFTMTRLCQKISDPLPGDNEIATVRKHAGGQMDLSALPQLWSEALTNDKGTTYTWRGLAWRLRLETISLKDLLGQGETEVKP